MPGVTFITTLERVVMDGQAQEVAPNSRIQYAFYVDEDGNYGGTNVNTGSYFEMVKIK